MKQGNSDSSANGKSEHTGNDPQHTPDSAPYERSEQELVRWQKLAELRQAGFNYPNQVKVSATSQDVLASFDHLDVAATEAEAPRFTIGGRVVQMRLMGKAGFTHLLDSAGKLQIYVKKDVVGEEQFNTFKELDLGDIVEVTGYPFTTKTGEKSLAVESLRLLVKGLVPLPEKWHGLTDVEARYRQRYVDLIANPDVREVFRKRAQVISYIRRFFDDHNFVEVETPVLQPIVGGATAKPFLTHYNALGADMVLRIAPELPLKKLVVGGLERVYEIARNFRNEGLSRKHNPEFTMIEFYRAYATFTDNMDLTEELLKGMVQKICGSLEIQFQGQAISFSSFKRISMIDSIREIGGVSGEIDLWKLEDLLKVAESKRIKLANPSDWGKVLESVWEEFVEHKLINPTFITHHPFSISPLARKNDENPQVTDRFELFVAGMEVANAYSELNDPEDQRQRFEAQAAKKAGGDEEACDVDEDFLRALEYGMPPTSGEGIGIDRLVMLLTDSASIRDVLLFPQLKQLGAE